MRLLIISKDVWRKDNSFGNTYSNIFDGVSDIEIANILLGDGKPDDVPYIKSTFRVSEAALISEFLHGNKARPIGGIIQEENKNQIIEQEGGKKQSFYSKMLGFGKRHHWQVLFWAREFIWRHGNINYTAMMEYIKSFSPTLIFLPYDYVFFTNRFALRIQRELKIPMVTEFAMDHYTLKRVSFSPLFWIDRLFKRNNIRKVVEKSTFLFVISEKLKREYEQNFKKECKVLYKRVDLGRCLFPYSKCTSTTPQFLFTGNIYANRWKTLAMLADCLKKLDFGHLDVYTSSPINNKIKKALEIPGYSSIHPAVTQEQVIMLQNNADILVHAEAFDSYNKCLVRCAISTKIMDYLSAGRSVLAIGPSDIASIEYITNSNLGFVANNEKMLKNILFCIKTNPSVLIDYSSHGIDFLTKNQNPIIRQKEFLEALSLAEKSLY